MDDARTTFATPAQRLSLAFAKWPLAVVGAACFLAMFAQRHIGLSLHDEGFLWYGAQRVLRGELPLRDFQAYDPGRYFWASAWMALSGGDGVVVLRVADAALAGITVALATWLVTADRRGRSAAVTLAVGAIFSLWMEPHTKAADSFAAVLLLFGLTRLIERPALVRYFQAGVCLGVAAMIGINHALYGTIAGLLAFAYLRGVPNPWQALGATISGGLVGYGPVLGLHLAAPGFIAGFVDSIVQIVEAGTTNVARPFPHLLAVLHRPHLLTATESLFALLLISIPIGWALAVLRLRHPEARAAVRPVVLAGLILSLPYAHYVVSRTDVPHATISILPVLAVVLPSVMTVAQPWRRGAVLALIFAAGLLITVAEHPVYSVLRGDALETLEIDGTDLAVRPDDAAEIRAARAVAAMAGPGSFFAGPYLPGAYALARQKSPIWEIYMLFPASPSRQRAEIARLRAAKVGNALITTDKVDGRSDLGLSLTHPLLLADLEQRLRCSVKVPESSNIMLLTTAPPGEPTNPGACAPRTGEL